MQQRTAHRYVHEPVAMGARVDLTNIGQVLDLLDDDGRSSGCSWTPTCSCPPPTRRAGSHGAAATWLTETLDGDRRVGVPWQTLGASVRTSTRPRVMQTPLTADRAWRAVEGWLGAPCTWVPPATETTARVCADLVRTAARPATSSPTPGWPRSRSSTG